MVQPPKGISPQNVSKFWESIKPQNNIEGAVEESWKKKVEFLDEVSLQNNVVVFLYNIFTNRFLYMSDKLKVLSGLEPSSYTAENGMDFAFSRAFPDHQHPCMLFNYLALSILNEDSTYDKKDILISMNFQLKNGNEQYVQVLQQLAALEFDNDNKPTLAISFGHYVGHIKKPDAVGCVVTTPDSISIYDYNFDTKALEPPKTFTDQERKIVELLAKGLDTKAIAKELFISPHTVDTHRRNLIKKTDCIDTTGVVAFAKLINLI